MRPRRGCSNRRASGGGRPGFVPDARAPGELEPEVPEPGAFGGGKSRFAPDTPGTSAHCVMRSWSRPDSASASAQSRAGPPAQVIDHATPRSMRSTLSRPQRRATSVALLDHGEIVPGRGMTAIAPSSPISVHPPVTHDASRSRSSRRPARTRRRRYGRSRSSVRRRRRSRDGASVRAGAGVPGGEPRGRALPGAAGWSSREAGRPSRPRDATRTRAPASRRCRMIWRQDPAW